MDRVSIPTAGNTGTRIRSLVLLDALTGAEKRLTTPVPDPSQQPLARKQRNVMPGMPLER
jgi:hypothetical protein